VFQEAAELAMVIFIVMVVMVALAKEDKLVGVL
jgi:hypothetical protein